MSFGDIGLSITSSSLPHTLIVSCQSCTVNIIIILIISAATATFTITLRPLQRVLTKCDRHNTDLITIIYNKHKL